MTLWRFSSYSSTLSKFRDSDIDIFIVFLKSFNLFIFVLLAFLDIERIHIWRKNQFAFRNSNNTGFSYTINTRCSFICFILLFFLFFLSIFFTNSAESSECSFTLSSSIFVKIFIFLNSTTNHIFHCIGCFSCLVFSFSSFSLNSSNCICCRFPELFCVFPHVLYTINKYIFHSFKKTFVLISKESFFKLS